MALLWFVLGLLPALAWGERFSCRGRILGAYYADSKTGCKAFHVCVRVAGGGVRDFRFFCPPGTLFHQEAQTCTDWGDDDPLACPDLYDGQFDLYKIGSGYDTKKISYNGRRDDEAEFGLQRTESGERHQQPPPAAAPASDLRAAHSSDFFSGQRERGRDDPAPPAPSARQSFRRLPQRVAPTAPPASTAPSAPPAPPVPSPQNRYDPVPKRKFVRKRPVVTPSTAPPPSTFAQNYSPEPRQTSLDRSVAENSARSPQQPQYSRPSLSGPQYTEEYVEVSRVTPKNNQLYTHAAPTPFPFTQPPPSQFFIKKESFAESPNYENRQSNNINAQAGGRPLEATVRNSFSVSPLEPTEIAYDNSRKNVEVGPNGGGRAGSPSASAYDGPQRTYSTTTPAYRNFNSVSYEPEKNDFGPFSRGKQSFKSEATPSTTVTYGTPPDLNTVAYRTNVGFDAQPANYIESDEDDGQYRPPRGEDDGQYRPELYERELLSGAHSLNIAASGNRLPDDQKRSKADHFSVAPRPFSPVPEVTPSRPPATAAPRTQPPTQPAYSQPQYTQQPQTRPPSVSTQRTQPPTTQRTFDVYKTYTTTSRPSDAIPPAPVVQSYSPVGIGATGRPTTHIFPTKTIERVESKPSPTKTSPPPPAPRPRPARPDAPAHAGPNAKEDASYDYAYYDTDPGFTEYDHIEEFGKTKKKV